MNLSPSAAAGFAAAHSPADRGRSISTRASAPQAVPHPAPLWSSAGGRVAQTAATAAAVEPVPTEQSPEPTLTERMTNALERFEAEAASTGPAPHPKRSTASLWQLVQEVPNSWAARATVKVPNVPSPESAASSSADAASPSHVRLPLLEALQRLARASTDTKGRAAAAASILRQALAVAPVDEQKTTPVEQASVKRSRSGSEGVASLWVARKEPRDERSSGSGRSPSIEQASGRVEALSLTASSVDAARLAAPYVTPRDVSGNRAPNVQVLRATPRGDAAPANGWEQAVVREILAGVGITMPDSFVLEVPSQHAYKDQQEKVRTRNTTSICAQSTVSRREIARTLREVNRRIPAHAVHSSPDAIRQAFAHVRAGSIALGTHAAATAESPVVEERPRQRLSTHAIGMLEEHGIEVPADYTVEIPLHGGRYGSEPEVRRRNTDALRKHSKGPRASASQFENAIERLNAQLPNQPFTMRMSRGSATAKVAQGGDRGATEAGTR